MKMSQKDEVILHQMVEGEKVFKRQWISSLQEKVVETIGDLFLTGYKMVYTTVDSDEESGELDKKIAYRIQDYALTSDFLDEKYVRWIKDNATVREKVGERMLEQYAMDSDMYLRTISEEHLTRAKEKIRGCIRFYFDDEDIQVQVTKILTTIGKMPFKLLIEGSPSIKEKWHKVRIRRLFET